MINLFVTGMLRSGTTLLQKALNSHPHLKVSYQPFPEIYIQIKKEFFKHIGLGPEYHALSHYCQERRYAPCDFLSWIESASFSREFIDKWSPQKVEARKEDIWTRGRHFSSWYSYLNKQMNSEKDILCCGSKEVLMEEYVPYFIKHDIFCIIIIRDPRDVISSLDYGRGSQFTGDHRPVLFNLRNWRKSLLFAYGFEDDPCLAVIRFEDLVLHPVEVLNDLATKIGIGSFSDEWWKKGFRKENGDSWNGNSSFGDISPFSAKAIGKFTKVLPEDTRLYIEAVCRREMIHMGYEPSPASVLVCKKRIKEFVDPFSINRTEFSHDYSSSSENVDYELKRIEEPENSFFLFSKAAEKIGGIQLR